MKKLLLEIGTEEIPARFLPDARDNLALGAEKALKENSIGFAGVKVYATPRRLALIVDNVAESQEDRVREVFGPPKRAAYAEDGSLTKAGQKFLEQTGATADELVVKKKDKGEYIAAVITEKGQPAREVLPELLKKLILSMSFPKSMRWGDGTLRFARPIQRICAVLGNETVEFEIDGIKSGNETRGHRFLSPSPVSVNAETYIETLRGNRVIVNQLEREETIKNQMALLAKAEGGTVVHDPDLLELVTDLVEHPNAVVGSFDAKYLELPEELLTTVMKGHQKYFSVKGSGGRLINKFLVISNMTEDCAGMVRKGAERVIRARFEDARFYWEEDLKIPLIENLGKLKRVTFYEGLGSLYDKTLRVVSLAEFTAKRTGVEGADNRVQAVAKLCKCDLITGVVREFPELQGVMGFYYALKQGVLNEALSMALKEQYMYSEDDVYNISTYGALLNLADRFDTIAAFFSIGMKPSGSQDPFALRRSALAAINILIRKKYDLTLRELATEALMPFNPKESNVLSEITEFMKARVENFLSSDSWRIPNQKDYSKDTIDSVLHMASDKPLTDVIKRLDALSGFKSNPGYNDFLIAIKRVRNIIPKRGGPTAVNEGLFNSDAERALYKALGGVRHNLENHISGADYDHALKEFLSLTTPINDFFTAVMVMDKDEAIKNNRLGMLGEIWQMVSEVADFSKLGEI